MLHFLVICNTWYSQFCLRSPALVPGFNYPHLSITIELIIETKVTLPKEDAPRPRYPDMLFRRNWLLVLLLHFNLISLSGT